MESVALGAWLLLTCTLCSTLVQADRNIPNSLQHFHTRHGPERQVGHWVSQLSPDDPRWCTRFGAALDAYTNNSSGRLWRALQDAVAGSGAMDADDNVARWMRQKCDPATWHRFTALTPYPTCAGTPADVPYWKRAACVGLRTCTNARNASSLPYIAIVLGATSRKVMSPSTDNLALFTVSLPSIAKTVECGFQYSVYLGYDAGDAFYDTEVGQQSLAEWFDRHVRRPLQDGGIDVNLVPTRVHNPSNAPGPVFNAVAQRARADGVDFFYRINDDTLLLTSWAGKFACALCSMGPPYGVVGPVESVRSDILTHDFVHAMHVDIFPEYYPPELTDGWLDDWISKVYGSLRSYRLAKVKVRLEGGKAYTIAAYVRNSGLWSLCSVAGAKPGIKCLAGADLTLHLVKTHGTRYDIDMKHADKLDELVQVGRRYLRDFVQHNLTALALTGINQFAAASPGTLSTV